MALKLNKYESQSLNSVNKLLKGQVHAVLKYVLFGPCYLEESFLHFLYLLLDIIIEFFLYNMTIKESHRKEHISVI